MTIPFYNARRVVENTGSVTDITLAFLAESAADVHLYAGITTNILLEDTIELVQGVDYTVSGIGVVGITATLTNPAGWSDYERFALVVTYPVTQPNDVDVGGPFGLRFENALDRQTFMLQSFFDEVSRAIKVPVTRAVGSDNTLESAPGQLIGWNADGSNFENYPTVTQSIQAALDAAIDANNAADDAEAAAEAAGAAARNDWHYMAFTGDGVTTDYALAIDPGTIANVIANFGGIVQLHTTMSLVAVGPTTYIRFSSPTPSGVPCEVIYGNANALPVSPIPDASITSAKYAPGSVGTTALADDSVTYAKMQNISATLLLLGRKTAGAGNTEEITGAELRDLFWPTGVVIDSAYAEYTTNADIATVIPLDDTIPQVTEGTQILSIAITPKSTTNKIRVRFSGETSLSAAAHAIGAIFINGGANAVQANVAYHAQANEKQPLVMDYEYTPGSITSQTISVRAGSNGATLRLNGTYTGRLFGGAMRATLVVEEIKA